MAQMNIIKYVYIYTKNVVHWQWLITSFVYHYFENHISFGTQSTLFLSLFPERKQILSMLLDVFASTHKMLSTLNAYKSFIGMKEKIKKKHWMEMTVTISIESNESESYIISRSLAVFDANATMKEKNSPFSLYNDFSEWMNEMA